MKRQLNFFDSNAAHADSLNVPAGLRYHPELIDQHAEKGLLARLRELPFKEFEFHGYTGKRRTVSFGWQYEFSGSGTLRKADDIPEFLLPLRARAAKFAGLDQTDLQHVLVIEYRPGTGIGWHRDRPVFGQVVGVSLLSPCIIRFRRKLIAEAVTGVTRNDQTIQSSKRKSANVSAATNPERNKPPTRFSWERMNLLAQPRSAYHLSGPARHEWQHSILRVDELRYSITFRTMSENGKQ